MGGAAGAEIQLYWADVQNLQRKLSDVDARGDTELCDLIFSI